MSYGAPLDDVAVPSGGRSISTSLVISDSLTLAEAQTHLRE